MEAPYQLTQAEDPVRAGPDLRGRDGHRVLLRRRDRLRLADAPQDRQVEIYITF